MDAFAHGGRWSLRRIRAEIDDSLRRTGEPPREIVLNPREMADLLNDPEIQRSLPSSSATVNWIYGVPIREVLTS